MTTDTVSLWDTPIPQVKSEAMVRAAFYEEWLTESELKIWIDSNSEIEIFFTNSNGFEWIQIDSWQLIRITNCQS